MNNLGRDFKPTCTTLCLTAPSLVKRKLLAAAICSSGHSRMLRVLLYQATSKLAASTLATKVKEMARRGLQKWISAICVIHLVQDDLACVRVSEDPRNPRHQLDPTPGKSGSIVQGVVEDEDEEDVELLVEGPAQGGHLDAIDGAIALTI